MNILSDIAWKYLNDCFSKASEVKAKEQFVKTRTLYMFGESTIEHEYRLKQGITNAKTSR